MNLKATLELLRAERDKIDRAIVVIEELASGDVKTRQTTTGTHEHTITPRRKAKVVPKAGRRGKLAEHTTEIRKMFENGTDTIRIAQKFKCSPEAIRVLLKREGWVRRPTALGKQSGKPTVTKLPPGASRRYPE